MRRIALSLSEETSRSLFRLALRMGSVTAEQIAQAAVEQTVRLWLDEWDETPEEAAREELLASILKETGRDPGEATA